MSPFIIRENLPYNIIPPRTNAAEPFWVLVSKRSNPSDIYSIYTSEAMATLSKFAIYGHDGEFMDDITVVPLYLPTRPRPNRSYPYMISIREIFTRTTVFYNVEFAHMTTSGHTFHKTYKRATDTSIKRLLNYINWYKVNFDRMGEVYLLHPATEIEHNRKRYTYGIGFSIYLTNVYDGGLGENEQ